MKIIINGQELEIPISAQKSLYDQFKEKGYTGTEEEFTALIESGPWLPMTSTMKIVADSEYISAGISEDYLAFKTLSGDTLIKLINTVEGSDKRVEIHDLSYPISDRDATSKEYVDMNFLKATGGTVTGNVVFDGTDYSISITEGDILFVDKSNTDYIFALSPGSMGIISEEQELYTILVFADGRISAMTNIFEDQLAKLSVGTPEDGKDAVNKEYLENALSNIDGFIKTSGETKIGNILLTGVNTDDVTIIAPGQILNGVMYADGNDINIDDVYSIINKIAIGFSVGRSFMGLSPVEESILKLAYGAGYSQLQVAPPTTEYSAVNKAYADSHYISLMGASIADPIILKNEETNTALYITPDMVSMGVLGSNGGIDESFNSFVISDNSIGLRSSQGSQIILKFESDHIGAYTQDSDGTISPTQFRVATPMHTYSAANKGFVLSAIENSRVVLTQAEYDALLSKDPNVMYCIKEG